MIVQALWTDYCRLIYVRECVEELAVRGEYDNCDDGVMIIVAVVVLVVIDYRRSTRWCKRRLLE